LLPTVSDREREREREREGEREIERKRQREREREREKERETARSSFDVEEYLFPVDYLLNLKQSFETFALKSDTKQFGPLTTIHVKVYGLKTQYFRLLLPSVFSYTWKGYSPIASTRRN
jgi:hypothetical protein